MIDTHCHLTYDPIVAQFDDVMARAKAAGVERMITIGTAPEDAAKARRLAESIPQIFCAVGLHPHYAANFTDEAAFKATMRTLADSPQVVALGEMGLDQHYTEPTLDLQRRAFRWQLELMRETGMPGIIHNRQATDHTLAMIRDSGVPGDRFVFHCFTGTDAELDAILAIGSLVSFTGIVTFKSSATLLASTTRVPLDRVMIETDAPYLTPAPHRKVKVNAPSYLPYTLNAMAAARGMTPAAFDAATTANAVRFFRLPV